MASKFLAMPIKALHDLTSAGPSGLISGHLRLGQRVSGMLAFLSLQHASALSCIMGLALAVPLPITFSTESLSRWILPPFTCCPYRCHLLKRTSIALFHFPQNTSSAQRSPCYLFIFNLVFYCLSLPDCNLSFEKAGALFYSLSCHQCLALCLAHNWCIICDE